MFPSGVVFSIKYGSSPFARSLAILSNSLVFASTKSFDSKLIKACSRFEAIIDKGVTGLSFDIIYLCCLRIPCDPANTSDGSSKPTSLQYGSIPTPFLVNFFAGYLIIQYTLS